MECVVRNRNIFVVHLGPIKCDQMVVVVYLILVNGDPTVPVGYFEHYIYPY